MNTGFIKVSAVSPRVTVANVEKNQIAMLFT